MVSVWRTCGAVAACCALPLAIPTLVAAVLIATSFSFGAILLWLVLLTFQAACSLTASIFYAKEPSSCRPSFNPAVSAAASAPTSQGDMLLLETHLCVSSGTDKDSDAAGGPPSTTSSSSKLSGDSAEGRPSPTQPPADAVSAELGMSKEPAATLPTASPHLSDAAMRSALAVRSLGKGTYAEVSLVDVCVEGSSEPLQAARKRQSIKHADMLDDEVAGMLAAAGSPFAVRYLGHVVRPGYTDLFVSLADGGSVKDELDDLLSRFPHQKHKPKLLLPLPRLRVISASVLHTLAEMHAHGYLHGDVKVANVLTTSSGRVLLADMGAARAPGPDGILCGSVGTHGYMAPEVAAEKPFNFTADVFSVGVLMMVCAVWHNNMPGVRSYLAWENDLPSCVADKPLRDFIAWLVTADPAQRPTALEAMQHPFLASVTMEGLML